MTGHLERQTDWFKAGGGGASSRTKVSVLSVPDPDLVLQAVWL